MSLIQVKNTLKNILNVELKFTDSIPLIGHVKGVIHYCLDDREGFNEAMISASRSFIVAVVGILGSKVCDPFGAYAGGVVGGIVADISISIYNSENYGHFQSLTKLFNWNMNADEGIYWTLTLVFDGLAGRSYAKIYENFKNNNAQYHQYKSEIENAVEQGIITLKDGQTASQLAVKLQKAASELKNAVKNDDFSKLGEKIVDTINIDDERYSIAKYLFHLREELKIEVFSENDYPGPGELILRFIFPLGKMKKIGSFETKNLHGASGANSICNVYQINSLIATSETPTFYAAVQKCQPCGETVKMILMQDVVTDTAFQTTVNLITHCVTIKEAKEERVSTSVIDDSLIFGSKSEFTNG
jgi:hypothetical protein